MRTPAGVALKQHQPDQLRHAAVHRPQQRQRQRQQRTQLDDNQGFTGHEVHANQGQGYYEERYRQRALHHLAQRAEKTGMKFVAARQHV